MEVRVKKLHKDAVIPSYAKDGDAGLDLTAVSHRVDSYDNDVFGTGLAIEIPKGYVGLLFPRSSNSKTNLRLTNSVGVIDSGYRGEIMMKYREEGGMNKDYEIGDRIGQLIILPYPRITFVEADELSDSERGNGGYGSSGR